MSDLEPEEMSEYDHQLRFAYEYDYQFNLRVDTLHDVANKVREKMINQREHFRHLRNKQSKISQRAKKLRRMQKVSRRNNK